MEASHIYALFYGHYFMALFSTITRIWRGKERKNHHVHFINNETKAPREAEIWITLRNHVYVRAPKGSILVGVPAHPIHYAGFTREGEVGTWSLTAGEAYILYFLLSHSWQTSQTHHNTLYYWTWTLPESFKTCCFRQPLTINWDWFLNEKHFPSWIMESVRYILALSAVIIYLMMII